MAHKVNDGEDAALDRLLAKAPAGGAAGPEALTARILAAAKAEGRPAQAASIPPLRRNAAIHAPSREPRLWRAGAALAASLLIGVIGGASTMGEPAVTALFEVAGLSEPSGQPWDEFTFDPASPIEEQL